MSMCPHQRCYGVNVGSVRYGAGATGESVRCWLGPGAKEIVGDGKSAIKWSGSKMAGKAQRALASRFLAIFVPLRSSAVMKDLRH